MFPELVVVVVAATAFRATSVQKSEKPVVAVMSSGFESRSDDDNNDNADTALPFDPDPDLLLLLLYKYPIQFINISKSGCADRSSRNIRFHHFWNND